MKQIHHVGSHIAPTTSCRPAMRGSSQSVPEGGNRMDWCTTQLAKWIADAPQAPTCTNVQTAQRKSKLHDPTMIYLLGERYNELEVQ